MSNRRKVRETVMKALYSFSIGNLSLEHVLDTIVKPEFRSDGFGRDFAERLFLRSVDNSAYSDKLIRDHIANWEIDRLAAVDRVILQMAITEILTFEDIPTKVTINEGIEIAKKYSTARSAPFVNGILDAVVLTLQTDGVLKKEGRGLVDLPARRKRPQQRDIGETDLPSVFEQTDTTDQTNFSDSPSHGNANASDSVKKGPKKPRIKRPPKNKN